MSPLFVELQAILHGLNLILERKWTDVSIESDSKLAVDICNSVIAWNGHQQALVLHIRHLLITTGANLYYIPRDANLCADPVIVSH